MVLKIIISSATPDLNVVEWTHHCPLSWVCCQAHPNGASQFHSTYLCSVFLRLFEIIVIVSTVHHVNYYFAKFKQTFKCNLGTQMGGKPNSNCT